MTMTTDALIEQLSNDVRAVGRFAVARRIALGLAVGVVAAMIAVTALLGVRHDLGSEMYGFSFWMKWTYTASLGLGAAYAVSRLARPDARSLRGLWLIAVPVLLLAGVAIGELATTPSANWIAMWLGRSWTSCPWLVLLLSAPIFLGLLWSFRRLAPTRFRAAGAAAGLAAGAWAATVYCLHCPEVSALFVLTWYSLGIALAAALGALIGPRLLRW
jgi:hypothetical protein